MNAFRQIIQLRPITLATPYHCERFQEEALKLHKDWRVKYSNTKQSLMRREARGEVELLKPNTILKWSVALQAAFERANRNAGKKCVRGVVPEEKLLTQNPWHMFTWIEGNEKKLRQFDHNELISLLDYFEKELSGLLFAPLFAKISLWSWARKLEVSSLQWEDVRIIGNEIHFYSLGKWNVQKWFRIPEKLYRDLQAIKTDSPFVFGGYPHFLMVYYKRKNILKAICKIRPDFSPENLGDWMYRQVSKWSKTLPNGTAYLHVFRKTTLQYARSGEDVNRSVANDASISESVMMTNYAREQDQELRQKSNRTYRRILNSLPVDVAVRYGYEPKPTDHLIERLDLARTRNDWLEIGKLAAEIAECIRQAG